MNLFDLYVRIAAKDEVSDKIPKIGNALKTGLATAGKVAAVGVGAATTAVAALTNAAVDGYKDYEQLVGGVETLFKGSADEVMKYADNAYRTAGLSANAYMETVTSFSASLLQSLGGDTEAAAKLADQAIVDMSDNANKMGTDMAMIQNAYNGFAKQNFTMLDNLKLGYGGTQEEMKRLLADAQAISGIEYDISSYADIVQAIHVIQTEMGITGTTAKEASSTISGSVASAKTAWQNLVTGIADGNADLDLLANNFVDSAGTAAKNILPVVKTALKNIGNLLEENGPEMVVGGVKLLGNLAVGAVKAIPNIVSKIPEIIDAIVDEFQENGPEIKEIGKDIVRGLWEGIKSLAGWLYDKAAGFVGDLVDSVKDKLGIHSPSRVFAGIGENMALGLGSGWEKEYSGVRRQVTSGLDFGTGRVSFAESGVGRSSAGIINGFAGVPAAGGNMTVNLMMPDGNVFARYYLPSFIDVAKANGTPIANPT